MFYFIFLVSSYSPLKCLLHSGIIKIYDGYTFLIPLEL